MPHIYSDIYHIVYSPKVKKDIEMKFDNLTIWLDDHCKQWLLSEEYGKNNNKHLDIVAWMKESKRQDKVRESLQKAMSDYGKIPIKAYAIEEDRLKWQIGYCLKEGNHTTQSDILDVDKDECLKTYEDCPNLYSTKEQEDDRWGVDRYVDEYVKYLIKNKLTHNIIEYKKFQKKNKAKLKYSTLCKIKHETLLEYLEIHDLYESSSLINMENKENCCTGYLLK